MQPDALMLFAAGLGTRMGALTATRPKPLIPVGGRALIDHAFDLVADAGIGRTVVNLHYLPHMIRQHLGARPEVVFSDESDRLLETGGGLLKARGLLGTGPVFTLNSDAVWSGVNPLRCLADAWDDSRMDALLLLVPKERASGHLGTGDFDVMRDGRIRRGAAQVYTGAQIIRTDRLHEIGTDVFSLNRMWDVFAAEDRLFGAVYPGDWCDVGRPEGIALAEDLLRGSSDV